MRNALRILPLLTCAAFSILYLSVSASRVVRAAQGSNFDLSGTIHDASKGKFTVDSGQGIFFHVVYDDKTTIVRADGTTGSEEDLKVGAKVHVVGDLSETGQVIAGRIEMIGDTKKAPAAASALGGA